MACKQVVRMLGCVAVIVALLVLTGCGGEYTLTINYHPGPDSGTVEQSGDGTYKSGEEVTLIAHAAPGWQFANWTGYVESSSASITVKMTQDIELTASFLSESAPEVSSPVDEIVLEGEADAGISEEATESSAPAMDDIPETSDSGEILAPPEHSEVPSVDDNGESEEESDPSGEETEPETPEPGAEPDVPDTDVLPGDDDSDETSDPGEDATEPETPETAEDPDVPDTDVVPDDDESGETSDPADDAAEPETPEPGEEPDVPDTDVVPDDGESGETSDPADDATESETPEPGEEPDVPDTDIVPDDDESGETSDPADDATEPETPETGEEPDVPDTDIVPDDDESGETSEPGDDDSEPETPETGEEPDVLDTDVLPEDDESDETSVPGDNDVEPETPETGEEPDVPDTDVLPEDDGADETSDPGDDDAEPETPEIGEEPEVPDTGVVPGDDGADETSDPADDDTEPEMPETGEEPDVPDTDVVPGDDASDETSDPGDDDAEPETPETGEEPDMPDTDVVPGDDESDETSDPAEDDTVPEPSLVEGEYEDADADATPDDFVDDSELLEEGEADTVSSSDEESDSEIVVAEADPEIPEDDMINEEDIFGDADETPDEEEPAIPDTENDPDTPDTNENTEDNDEEDSDPFVPYDPFEDTEVPEENDDTEDPDSGSEELSTEEGEDDEDVEGEVTSNPEEAGENESEGEGESVVEGEGELVVEGEVLPVLTDLEAYLAYDDGYYGFSQPLIQPYGSGDAVIAMIYVIQRMRSQYWNPEGSVYDGEEWTHPVVIINPVVRLSDTALLFIDGGSRNSTPQIEDEAPFIQIALHSGTPVVHIKNVPSQPISFWDEVIDPDSEDNYSGDDFILRSRTEDEIIAYSYDRFLKTYPSTDNSAEGEGEAAVQPLTEWPLLFPMVKAAVKAMDTAESVLYEAGGPVDGFVVAGASKRGWTTWLTGASDPRVKAIAPIVINVLNMEKNLAHHRKSYGYWSPAIYDYAQKGVFDQLIPDSEHPVISEAAQALLQRVDPYQYALEGRYAMPIFMLNATGDEFFVPDLAADDDSLEVLALHGEARLSFVPNVGHGMGGLDAGLNLSDSDSAIGKFMAWYMAVTQDIDRPNFEYSVKEPNGEIKVTVDPDNKPVRVRLWRATSTGRRDFRNPVLGPRWIASTLNPRSDGITYRGKPAEPAPGNYTAFFIQLEYVNEAQAALPSPEFTTPNLSFTTPVRVLPVAEETGAPHYPEFTGVNANEERFDAVLFGEEKLPVAMVYGSPYDMGHYYGQIMSENIKDFLADYGPTSTAEENWLKSVWRNNEDTLDSRILSEIEGIAAGSGAEISLLQMAHAKALYSQLTEDFSTAAVVAYRDLASGMDAMHTVTVNAADDGKSLLENHWEQHLCAVVYVPEKGVPHVVLTYAGLAVGIAGANLAGISMNEIQGTAVPTGASSPALMRSVLYDALSLREAMDITTRLADGSQAAYLIADGRNEKRAVLMRLSEPMENWRYDMAKTDFRIETPGIVYDAGSVAARTSLSGLLSTNLSNLSRNRLLTIAGTVPTALYGYNVLNVAFEYAGGAMTMYVAVARNGQEAFQDYFDQVFVQQLLP